MKLLNVVLLATLVSGRNVRMEKFRNYHRARTQRDLIGQNRLGNDIHSHRFYLGQSKGQMVPSIEDQILGWFSNNSDKMALAKASQILANPKYSRNIKHEKFLKHHFETITLSNKIK